MGATATMEEPSSQLNNGSKHKRMSKRSGSSKNVLKMEALASSKRKSLKIGRSSSHSSTRSSSSRQLTKMLEDECHNSFRLLPGEEPTHVWNTDEAEAHVQTMKRLDKKLAKYNDDIAKLKEALQQADEKCAVKLERIQQRECDARQEIVDLEEASQQVEKESLGSNLQFSQLQAKLEANTQKIRDLRQESKRLNKDLRRQEKTMDKLQFHNLQLEESSADLLASYSDLCSTTVFDEANLLEDYLEEGREQYAASKDAVNAMHERYMNEAHQRLEMQKGLASILTMIQTAARTDGTVPAKLANDCTDVGIECENRWKQIMAELETQEEEEE